MLEDAVTGSPLAARPDFLPRNSVAEIHRRLRQQIVANEIAVGLELNQTQLAKTFGVSRGPVREALRMLQEEGLVEAERNLRSRVAPIHPEEVDAVYAQRILLEGLGVTITAPSLGGDEFEQGESYVATMVELQHNMDDYMKPHHDFHRLLISQLPPPLLATAEQFFTRTERYRRFYSANTAQSAVIAAAEHRHLLDACRSLDVKVAAKVLAEHYTRTARHVLAVLAPAYEPRAVRAALALFDSRPSYRPSVGP